MGVISHIRIPTVEINLKKWIMEQNQKRTGLDKNITYDKLIKHTA